MKKSNVNIENSVNCSAPNTNDLLPTGMSNSESSDHRHIAADSESDMKPITPPLAPTGVILDSKDNDKTLRAAAKDLQNDNDAAFSTPLSPINHSPPSPLMEIIPPPLSHQLQVTTPLESATAVASNTNPTSTRELQSLSEIQHTPCMLYPSWHFPPQAQV
jgi:hypothetical protein